MSDEHDDDLEPIVEEGEEIETEHFPDQDEEDDEPIESPSPVADESDDRDADEAEI